ncbi:MAG: hypothetical protein AB7Q29_04995 [Vicinamibacterales bacterium]
MTVLLLAITVLSLATAAIATFLSWRVIDESRRRSAARVERLAASVDAIDPSKAPRVALAHLLEPSDTGGVQRAIALAGTVGLLLLLVVLSFGQLATGRALAESAGSVAAPAGATAAPGAESVEERPLDLMSLTHERSASGALELRGAVNRTEPAAALNRVTAVALLFDNQGTFLGSERAPLQLRSLDDDAHATFVLSVPDAARVGRYRISFRDGDRIVPHVDRREIR